MKLTKKLCGIYEIRNTINGHVYIGQSVNIATRWKSHVRELNSDAPHDNDHLQNAWNLYGPDAFTFELIDEYPADELKSAEQYWMNMAGNDYNICRVAGSPLGMKRTDEAKAKMSASKMGNTNAKGPRTAESRAKMAGNTNAKDNVPWNKGKTLSDATRAKMSAAGMGKVISPEQRAKTSKAMMGNTHAKGCVRSAETRAKMSAAAKARWARQRAERRCENT